MSNVWQYSQDATPKSADCKICSKTINRCNNTTRLHDNLKKFHGDNEQYKKSVTQKLVQTELNVKENTLSAFDFRIHPCDLQIHNLIAEFIILDCQAYNVVENNAFKSLIKVAFPKYKLPGREFLIKFINDIHEKYYFFYSLIIVSINHCYYL
jgi:hypothetical protein